MTDDGKRRLVVGLGVSGGSPRSPVATANVENLFERGIVGVTDYDALDRPPVANVLYIARQRLRRVPHSARSTFSGRQEPFGLKGATVLIASGTAFHRVNSPGEAWPGDFRPCPSRVSVVN
jgi:hypothetical protein